MTPLMISVSGVRGVIGPDFHPLVVARWSGALADLLPPGPLVVGRDSRPSGAVLARVSAEILRSCGRDVWDLGIVPTPTVQVAVEDWRAAGGLILTASHNPAEWNACKFVGEDGTFLSSEAFAQLRARVERETHPFQRYERWGRSSDRGAEAIELHGRKIEEKIETEAIRSRSIRILLDCVHGAGAVLLPGLLRRLGAVVDVRHEEPHGRFPREPEPTGPALLALGQEAERGGYDFALAVDPDADRCAVAVPGTDAIGEEWTLPLVAAHLLRRRVGTVVTNLSTSTRLDAVVDRSGSRLERTPVGEAHVVARMREAGAVLGGEGNGGVIDPQIHLGRDAAVAAAWLLEAHASHPGGLGGLASAFPPRYLRKGKLPTRSGIDEAGLLERLEPLLGPPDDRRDGLRWGRDGGFIHVRFSGTEPILRIVVEAPTPEEAGSLFDQVLHAGSRGDGG